MLCRGTVSVMLSAPFVIDDRWSSVMHPCMRLTSCGSYGCTVDAGSRSFPFEIRLWSSLGRQSW